MKFFNKIFSYIPEVNTLSGLIFYTLSLIILRIIFMNLLKIIEMKFYANGNLNNDNNNDNDEFNLDTLGTLDVEIKERILEARKKKAKEAVEYLKKFN